MSLNQPTSLSRIAFNKVTALAIGLNFVAAMGVLFTWLKTGTGIAVEQITEILRQLIQEIRENKDSLPVQYSELTDSGREISPNLYVSDVGRRIGISEALLMSAHDLAIAYAVELGLMDEKRAQGLNVFLSFHNVVDSVPDRAGFADRLNPVNQMNDFSGSKFVTSGSREYLLVALNPLLASEADGFDAEGMTEGEVGGQVVEAMVRAISGNNGDTGLNARAAFLQSYLNVAESQPSVL